MASIGNHISNLRTLLKQYSQSSTPYTDSQLFSIFSNAAALVSTRALEKGTNHSFWNTKWYCVKLVEDFSHPCPECYPIGCKVLKSVYKIPRPLQVRNRDLIRVATLDHKELHMIMPYERQAKLTDEFFQNVKMATFVNDHLIVYSRNKPVVVLVSGHFNDITEWAEIPVCDDSGSETGDFCYNPLTDEFPLDSDLVQPAYEECLKLLGFSLKVPHDNTNNSNNQI